MNRERLQQFLYKALTGLRADAFWRLLLKRKGAYPVLNLHRVSPDSSPYWPALQPVLFRELLDYLAPRFNICTLDQATKPSAKLPLVLSFDDGYRDFLEFALPQLRRRSLPANMNIIPECVLSGRPPWNVLLYDFLSSVSLQEAIAVELPGLAPLRNEDSTALKAGLGMRLSRFLKQRPAAERGPLWELFRERYMRGRSFDVTAMMTLHELRSMPGEISLGAHSFSHESMGYESDQFFQDDFRRCQTFFREHLDLPVGIYAFPNGSYRRSQIDWLLAQGVERVLLVDEKLAPLGKHPVLPRLTFSADTRQEAVLKGIGFGRRLARPGAD